VRTDLVDIALALIVLLASEEEIEPAAGYARRDQRRRLPYALMVGIRLPLGIALIVGRLLADSGVLIVFGVLFTLGEKRLNAPSRVMNAPDASF
jgi:hypothetical protein